MDDAELHDLKLLANVTGARLHVLQRAIGALIMTHPDPDAFATAFAQATRYAQEQLLTTPEAESHIRADATSFAAELLELAEDAARNRRAQPGD